MNKELNSEQINELFLIYKKYYDELYNFKTKNNIKIRFPNFPEGLSENIIRLFIINKENRNCHCSNVGDLIIENQKIEIKCFSSKGPTSFGPKEKWKEIYFLDCLEFKNNKFRIYKCNLSNDSHEWQKIQINKNETFYDVCMKGKRPRINFEELKKQLLNNISLVYDGNFENLFK